MKRKTNVSLLQRVEFPPTIASNCMPRKIYNQLLLSIKRFIDISVALVLVVLLAPVLFFLWALVFIDSGGSPVFRQQRKGAGGRPFFIYKFRTIRLDRNADQVRKMAKSEVKMKVYKLGEDYRFTYVGRILRKFSLDELPQLMNVIRGDMSLVGPRPFSERVFTHMSGLNSDFDQWVGERHQMRPGMTGLWQVSGRSNLPPEELIRLDLEYVRNWTLAGDILILFRTVPAVIFGKGAY